MSKGENKGGASGHIRGLTPSRVTATDISLTEEPKSPKQKLEGSKFKLLGDDGKPGREASPRLRREGFYGS